MSENVRLQVVIPLPLFKAIEKQADHEKSTLSHVARRALFDVFQPDEATVSLPENMAVLTAATEREEE